MLTGKTATVDATAEITEATWPRAVSGFREQVALVNPTQAILHNAALKSSNEVYHEHPVRGYRAFLAEFYCQRRIFNNRD